MSVMAVLSVTGTAVAQTSGALTGRVTEAETGAAVSGAAVSLEGTDLQVLTDSLGRYRLTRVPPGPQLLRVEHLGYATARAPVTVKSAGVTVRDVTVATSALALPGLSVTADVAGRARGELGTASVIGREAIEVQSATSLAGILELVPGVELQPPGIGGVQQFALRSVPVSGIGSPTLGGASAAELASAGTLIVLDGVPLSNNANLQTTGPRGEFRLPTSAGGGIDLRRIPASTLERVEVIRGVPSARYGDLTQGAIVVETRAGAFRPDARGLFDPNTAGGTLRGGWDLGAGAATANFDLTRTLVSPGSSDDRSYRFAGQLSHRLRSGSTAAAGGGEGEARLTLDSRLDVFQVLQESPEDREIAPGVASSSRDRGIRASERARLRLSEDSRLELTLSVDHLRQRSFRQLPRVRGGLPFTDRLTEGRAFGRFIGGEYVARVDVDGEAWLAFSRLEGETRADWLGLDHTLRAGLELRREWNAGAGMQFDIEFPPQVSFNGVQGFDRPRRFDAVPPLANTAFYIDERILRVAGAGLLFDLQAGLRLDLLHEGESWLSGVRDAAVQPRLNVQLAPRPWLRLHGGFGRVAKLPTLTQLHPAPQYFDVVNVNWFANDPAERLAVLTTFIRDVANPDLDLARGKKVEAGVELSSSSGEWALSAVGFQDRTDGGIGIRHVPGHLLRDRFALADTTAGTGRPPTVLEPPTHTDTVPILLDVPDNNLTLRSSGVEMTARLPEWRQARLRLEVQGAWVESEFHKDGIDLGRDFGGFQMDARIPRAPYWENVRQTGSRGLVTYRVIHHQPAVGLVVTAVAQHVFHEENQNVAGVDTLAFAGYLTRAGELVPVPPQDRTLPQYRDLRRARAGVLTSRNVIAPDWLLNLQVSLALPFGGRLSFYGFNVLDRPGKFPSAQHRARFWPPLRFGLEGSVPWPQ